MSFSFFYNKAYNIIVQFLLNHTHLSQIHQHLQLRNLSDMVFFKTWCFHFLEL
jgi:hypothetical protein